jgi:hypothetical protein
MNLVSTVWTLFVHVCYQKLTYVLISCTVVQCFTAAFILLGFLSSEVHFMFDISSVTNYNFLHHVFENYGRTVLFSLKKCYTV